VVNRSALLLAGAAISAVMYSATIKADLGLGPLYVVQQGLAGHLGLTIGQSVMVVGSVLTILSIVMRQWPGFGTVSLPFLVGAMVDACNPHMPEMHALALRVAVVAVASFLMALGGALIIRSRFGAAAPDLVMLALSRLTGRSNRDVRLAMEASWIVGGWLLGGVVGVGTVITGVMIGPSLHFWIERLHSESPEHEHVVV
jgi:uncharacterized membrane protein YczE